MMSPIIMKKLFETFKRTMKSTYIWIEDIYITGILSKLNNIGFVNLRHLIHSNNIAPNNTTLFMIAQTENLEPKEITSLWQNIFVL